MGRRSQVAPKVTVTDKRLQEAFHTEVDSQRSLVSVEIEYVKKTLGKQATEEQIRKAVVDVRKLPWDSLIVTVGD